MKTKYVAVTVAAIAVLAILFLKRADLLQTIQEAFAKVKENVMAQLGQRKLTL